MINPIRQGKLCLHFTHSCQCNLRRGTTMPDRHAARHHMQTMLRRSAHSTSRRSINCSILTEARCNPIASLAPHANCSRHVGTDCASVSFWCTIRLPCPVYTDRAWHYTAQAFKLITTYASSYTWHSNYKLQTFKCKPSNCNLQTCNTSNHRAKLASLALSIHL